MLLATTAAAAQQKFASFRPHAVVLDLGLPDGDGMDVFRALLAIDPEIPIILSSGHGDWSRIRATLGEDVDFLAKPYSGLRYVRWWSDGLRAPDVRRCAGPFMPR